MAKKRKKQLISDNTGEQTLSDDKKIETRAIQENRHIPAPEPDLPNRDVIVFFGALAVFFIISFLFKYICPNVPEYVFERILLVFLAIFCIAVLYRLSPGLREKCEKILIRKNNIPETTNQEEKTE